MPPLKLHALGSCSLALCLCMVISASRAADWVIHAGTLRDGISATPLKKVSIVGHDDKIVAVTDGFVSPPGADIIDLSDATVMPGFIDCHVHIAQPLPSRTNGIHQRP